MWSVNYRLDHPPLTKADKEFRALVAGANKVEVNEYVANPTKGSSFLKHKDLDEKQTRELIENIRLLDSQSDFLVLSANSLNLVFYNGDKMLHRFPLHQTKNESKILMSIESNKPTMRQSAGVSNNTPHNFYDLHPRFNKRLNRALDAYLPQRLRP